MRVHEGRWERLPGDAGTLPDVSVLRFGPDGTLWIGTDHSLFSLQRDGRLRDVGGMHAGLANERVQAILPLPDGQALVGNRHGLFRVAGGRVQDWGRAQGLPDTAVLAIQASRWGGVLVGGSAGVWQLEHGARGRSLPSVPKPCWKTATATCGSPRSTACAGTSRGATRPWANATA